MDIKHLTSFESVARLKSYSKAAETLFLTQPAITAHITLLEKELQTSLFIKHRTPVQMTESGELLLSYSQKILNLIQQARNDIDKIQSGFLGQITVYAAESIIDPITTFLREFQGQHLQISFTLSVSFPHEIIERVIDGYAHIGLTTTSTPNFSHPLLNCHYLFEDEAIPILSPQHPFADFSIIPRATVAKTPLQLVSFGNKTDLNQQILRIFEQANLPIKTVVNLNYLPSLINFIKDSRYLSFIPRILAQSELASGGLITRPIASIPPIKRYAYLISKKSDSLSPLVQQFQSELLAQFNT